MTWTHSIPQPPVPQGIREALEDCPELIRLVQDDPNDLVADLLRRRATFSAFEEAIRALEGRFDKFYIDTHKDVEAAEAGRDQQAIERAKEHAAGGGLVGGTGSAVAGDKIADAMDQSRIYTQRGSDGHQWRFDEKQGWGRLPHPGEFGPQGPPSDLAATAGMTYDSQTRLLHAGSRLADELNYKASNVAVELALAQAPPPRNPFSQPAGPGDAFAPDATPWTRDPATHQWSRFVADPAQAAMGVATGSTEQASRERSARLDQAAQAVIASNIANSSQAIAQRYQAAYDQYGWKQHGPVPAAVTTAAETAPSQHPTQTRALFDPAQPRRFEAEPRLTPTPGGMSFAEAHKRRDEPEQISPGSLRPVGKLDASTQAKGSPLYRAHQAQEQDLMRGLGIAMAQDRERFKNEPGPGRGCVSMAVVDPIQAARVPAEQGFDRGSQIGQQRELDATQRMQQEQAQGMQRA